jgi:carotenoid 1,2-hydratase
MLTSLFLLNLIHELYKMATASQKLQNEQFSFSSSIASDVWHPKKDAKAYEWWYFDALSDDGKEAIVIIFLDNFVFSPRYNSKKGANISFEDSIPNPESRISNLKSNVPAVVFVYYRDGKPIYRAINEFDPANFSAGSEIPECKIGESGFKMETASYGSGYLISINAKLNNGRRIEANFEWVSIEADFVPEKFSPLESSHSWNMVAPRSDVSGKINIFDKKGKNTDVRHFRGTGYHDHNLDNRWLPDTVKDWHWGRVHFADSTAVFYRYCETGANTPTTKLLVIRDGKLIERDVFYVETEFSRDKFGIRYPNRMRFESDDNIKLRVKHRQIIDSSFFYLRFLSEMTLTLRDGKPRRTLGITEYLAPKALKYRWLNWLINMRIGRNGKGSFLP